MTWEKFTDLLIEILDGLGLVLAVVLATIAIGLIAGYTVETYAHRADKCINAACDECKQTGRFVRHSGCNK